MMGGNKIGAETGWISGRRNERDNQKMAGIGSLAFFL